MTEYNKTSLIQGAVVFAVAVVVFFSIIAFYYLVNAGAAWCFPAPFAAIVYACVTFVKKYYPKK